jgi:hypothetical protein
MKNDNERVRLHGDAVGRCAVTAIALHRQSEHSQTAGRAFAIPEAERAAVIFGDLAAKEEAYSRAAGLGGEEWHEQICGIGQASPVVFD